MITLKQLIDGQNKNVYCSTNIPKPFTSFGRRKKKHFDFIFTFAATRRNIQDINSVDYNIADYRMYFSAN